MARDINGSTTAWRKLRAKVLNRDNHQCQVPMDDGTVCGQPASHAGHIDAHHHGGPAIASNLRAECPPHSHAGGAAIGGNHRHQPTPSRWYKTTDPHIETR